MTEMAYSLTGPDILNVIQGMTRQKIEAGKIAEVYHVLRGSFTGEMPTDIEQKINQVLLGIETKERSLSDEVREWVLSSSGVFLSSLVVKELGLSSPGDIKNLSKVLERLRKEGLIDRHGDKRGCYRLRETDLQAMDIMKPSEAVLNIRYPLYINALFVTLPRNIIVVAGEPDSGKTAFLLNFVQMNMEDFEIHYFNSEMGEMELRSRLSKFGTPGLQEFQKVHWWERSSDFADVVRPDAVNVIDFLEITEDFWKIGTWIKQIHDRLKKGIAVIAIQKKRGAEMGRGGHVTLEKPRLYLNMEPGKVKIVKGKNWRDEENNPNGQELTFKLVKGCNFKIESLWAKPEQAVPKKTKSYGAFVAEEAV
jgi:hypothetical protein